MISVDSSYVRAVERSERYVKATVNINNVDYSDVGNLVYNSSIGSGSLSIGSTNASTVSFKFKRVIEIFRENQVVIPKLGIKLANGQYKYIKLGHFYIKDVKIDRNSKTTFVEAVDKMALLNSRFESRLLYPTNALNVIEEISNLIGVRFNNTNIQSVMISKPEGFTIREVLGFIGQILASFVVFNREGELEFRRLNRTSKRISKSHYFLNGLVLSDIDYRVNGIAVDLKNKDKSIVVAGEAIGNQIKLVNPIMTQSFLNTAFSKVRDIRFKPFSLKYQGDPALEVGDWVSVESYTGNFVNVPVLSMKLEFNGGLKSTISADVKATSSTSYEYKGTMERQIQFLNARIGADGSRIYSDVTEPDNPIEGDSWFKPNGAFTDLLIYENGEWVLKVSTGNAEELITKITKDEVLAPKLAAGIGRFIEVNADRLSAGAVTFEKLAGDVSSRLRDGLATRDDIARIEINNERIKQSITSEVTKQTGEPLARVIENLNEVRESVRNINIRGRNLVIGTSEDWSLPYTSFNGSTNHNIKLYKIINKDLKLGDTLFLKMYIECNDIVGNNGRNPNLLIQSPGNVTSWGAGALYEPSINNITNRVYELEKKFIVTENHLRNNFWTMFMRTDNLLSGSIRIKSCKLEQGPAATPWTPAPEDLEIDYIGKNWLRDTLKMSGVHWVTSAPNGEVLWGENTERYFDMPTFSWRSGPKATPIALIQVELGDTYTFSTWVQKESAGTVYLYLYDGLDSAARLDISREQRYRAAEGEWIRVEKTFTVTKEGTLRIRIAIAGTDEGGFSIAPFKLDKGKKATPWSPHPEDAQETLNSIPSLISTEVTNRREELKGVGIDRLEEFYLVSPSSSGITASTSGWSTSLPTMTATNKYLWTYEKTHLTDGTIRSTTPVIIGTFGRDGRDGRDGTDGTRITRVTNYYKATSQSSGLRENDSGWTTTTQPLTPTNKYLWNYEHIEYSDNTFYKTDPHVVGVYGDKGEAGRDGVSVTRIEEFYLRSASNTGVTTSTSGWSSSISTPTETLKYLWKYERTHLSNGNTKETAPVIISTFVKDGKGILRIENFYLLNNLSTGVTTSTSGWSTSVKSTTSTNRYLWNYEKIYYSDGTHTTTLPVVIGTHGLQGATGPAGADGNSVHIRYSNSPTGAGMTTSGAGKSYIGIRMAPANSVSSNPSDYTWTLIKGADGERGLPGRDGVNGKTSYLHIAYADDERGNGFSQNPTGKSYIGTYTDNVELDSSDKSRYSWARIKGERGDRGLTGATGAKGETGATGAKGDRGEKGEDYEGSNLLPYPRFDEPFSTLYGSLTYINTTNSTAITPISNGFSATKSGDQVKVRLLLKTKTKNFTITDYNNSHIVMNFRAKASTPVKLNAYMDRNSKNFDVFLDISTEWKWYSATLSAGQEGIGSLINLFTDKACTLEMDSIVVQNLGAMQKILESEKKIKVFESTVDNFTSQIGTVSTILSMNLDNLCTETDATKTGNDLYFNLKENKVQGGKYTVFADISNAPPGKEAGVYNSEEYQNDKRLLKNGLNTWVFTSTNASDTVNLHPLGLNTTVTNVRVYKGDLSESSFATKEETAKIKSLIDQQKDRITLSVSEVEKIKTTINPGENLYVSQRGTNDRFFKTRVSMEANTYYTLVADLTGVPSGSQSLRLYDIRPGSKNQAIFNGRNVFLVSYNISKTEINLDSIPNGVSFNNVQIYKGDYRVNFGDFVSRQEASATITAKVEEGQASILSKVVGKTGVISSINQSAEKIQISADKVDISGTLSAYAGEIGGFRLGERREDGYSDNWFTGINQYKIGMSDGNIRNDQTALWVNWGNRWNQVGDNAWYVLGGGEMYCRNTSYFYKGIHCYNRSIDVHGNDVIGDAPGGGKTSAVWWSQKTSFLSSSSDKKLKKNIKDSSYSALSDLSKISIKEFKWIDTGKIEKFGAIAQELEKVFPDKVLEDKGIKKIKYFEFTPYLIKAIQELSEENKLLKLEIQDIKETLKEIKNESRNSK